MNPITPKITVITVAYQAKEALKVTAESVFNQRYEPLEYIIVDGGSTDGTVELIESFGNKVNQWVSEPDRGIYDAMNKGVRMATGEWIIFLNAGDMFAKNNVLARIFFKTPEADVIYGDVLKNDHIKKAEPPHNSHRMFFCHQSCLTKRECLLDYPFDTNHKMSADFKFFKLLFKKNKRFLQVNFPIADFDTTGISNTKRAEGLMDNIKVINEVDGLYEKSILLSRLYFVYIMCKLRGK